MNDDLRLVGPVRDSETGILQYVVRQGDREVSFAVIPQDAGEGEPGWIMRFGEDDIPEGNPGFEPYETEGEAVEAGMRAARQALGG